MVTSSSFLDAKIYLKAVDKRVSIRGMSQVVDKDEESEQPDGGRGMSGRLE